MHLSPAFLPSGIPGIYDEMDGAIQHAAHPGLHSNDSFVLLIFIAVKIFGKRSMRVKILFKNNDIK